MDKKKKQLLKAGAVVAAGLAGTALVTGAVTGHRAIAPTVITAADAVVINGEEINYDQLLASVSPRRTPVGQHKKMYGPPRDPNVGRPREPIKLVYGPPPVQPPRVEIDTTSLVAVDSVLVETRVIATVAQMLGINTEVITRNSNFTRDLGADSLDMVEVIIALEKEWGVTFRDEALNSIQTVGDVIDYIYAAIRSEE